MSTSATPSQWTLKDMPPLAGKLAIVTGGAGGLGYETCLALASTGATVIVAGRNAQKGSSAVNNILKIHPSAQIAFGQLDLGSLKSISDFASSINSAGRQVSILVNNAGVMAPPKREVTEDGFELHFGTNHLGHFALTASLLPSLRGGRVINVSAGMTKFFKLHSEDLQWEKSYSQWPAYGSSKMANLLFTFELHLKSQENGWGIQSLAAHPGYCKTDLVANGPGEDSLAGWFERWFMRPWMSHSVQDGALPILYAATSPNASSGGYYGPQGMMELKGQVGEATVPEQAKNEELAKILWDVSEKLTKVNWVSN